MSVKLIVQVAVAVAEKKRWSYVCGSPQETKWRNIEATSELSVDQET